MYSPLCGSGCALCILRSPTGGPYPPSGPGKTGGTGLYSPLCGSGWALHTSFSHGGIPIPQVAQVGTEELRCIHRYVGMPGTCVSSLSHGASLSPKRPTQDRGDSSVSAAVWELVDLVYPCFPMARSYPPSGPGRLGGTRVYPLLCGGGWTLCILVPPRGVRITQAAQAGPEGLGYIRRCVGVAGPCVSSFSHWRPYHPSGSGRSGATRVYSPLCGSGCALCILRSSTGRPYPQSSPSRAAGGTRLYAPLCGYGWTLCILVLPRGVPIPQAAHAGPAGLECLRRCVGMAGPCVSSFSHRASLSPERPTQDRGDSGVTTAMWDCLDLVYPRYPTGRPYPASGPGRTGGTRVYPPLSRICWTLCFLVLPRGVPIPQAAQAGPEGLGCIRLCVGASGPCGSSLCHGASLSPKRPRQDRRNSIVSAAVWEWLDLVDPRSPTRRPYPPSGPGTIRGTRPYPPLCGSACPCVSSFSCGASLSPKRLR